MANIIARAAVNNAILDPLSGFDVDVFVQDQVSGKQMLAGSFTSFQFTVRNSTEPYMEFNQRIPRLLDGEYQFGWVLERGCIDVRFIEQTFGIDSMSRDMRLNRSPRFQITVELNAPELDGNATSFTAPNVTLNNNVSGNPTPAPQSGGAVVGPDVSTRKAKGRYRLIYAKTDALTFGAMAGRSVVANRWEGLCEGIMYSDSTSGWAGVNFNDNFQTNSGLTSGVVSDTTAPAGLQTAKPTWVADYTYV